ncbi:hypothetical protein N7523_010983 [Penicillium sp. IBT 18751x]|nr:hypothetical protein N7523_010983 [Penicillium sp. IBT 18751x]
MAQSDEDTPKNAAERRFSTWRGGLWSFSTCVTFMIIVTAGTEECATTARNLTSREGEGADAPHQNVSENGKQHQRSRAIPPDQEMSKQIPDDVGVDRGAATFHGLWSRDHRGSVFIREAFSGQQASPRASKMIDFVLHGP